MAKARRIILEGVRDHIVSNLHGKETYLFQNTNDHGKLALKDKIKNINMEKGDIIVKYLTKFTQCWDELGSVSFIVFEDDLVNLALLGLPKSWENY